MATRERKLSTEQAAALVGVQPVTWRSYVSRQHPRANPAPQPDGREEFSRMPWWWESTVSGWHATRPGPGARTDLD